MGYENDEQLSHHGILGQKWGHRNGPPYPLSYTGHSAAEKKAGWSDSLSSKSQKKLAKQLRGLAKTTRSSGDKRRKVAAYRQPGLESSEPVKKLYDELKGAREKKYEASKIGSDFLHLPEDEYKAWVVKAADKFYEEQKGAGRIGTRSREDVRTMYLYDDWDQGPNSTFSLYCKSRGTTAEKEVHKEVAADNVYRKEVEKSVRKLLGDYADIPLGFSKRNDTVSKAVEQAIDNLTFEEAYRRRMYASY